MPFVLVLIFDDEGYGPMIFRAWQQTLHLQEIALSAYTTWSGPGLQLVY